MGLDWDCIAHRGFAGVNPENTLAAVRDCAGADAVEVDARRCGSGEVVVCHDAAVDRVSDGEGAVADLSREDLSALDVLGTGEGVPTLAAVAEALPPGVGLNVELKEQGIAADALAPVADVDDVLDSAFDPAALREAAAAGDRPLALLFGASPATGLATAQELDCAAVHPAVALCDEGFVGDCHDAGLRLNAWTIRDGETAQRAHRAGVDGLIADAPAFCGSD